MKSSVVLATLVSLAVAGPIATRDDCSCEPFMCIQQEGKQCECELDAAKQCHEKHVNAGLNCPFPDVSEECTVFSILPISIPEVTPTSVPQNKRVAKPDDPLDQCQCSYQCLAQVGPDCECEVKEKLACYARQQEAGFTECPFPTFSDRCAQYATATASAPTPTATVGKEGDACGAFTFPLQPPCGPNLYCQLKDEQVADLGGVCKPVTSTSTAPPTPTATVGKKGDGCDAFTFPPQPPCGPGLTCVHEDPQIPDVGGTCQPTEGKEGDGCNAFTSPPQPPCGPGLVCVPKNPNISDIGGTCQKPKPGNEGDKCESGEGATLLCADGLVCEQEGSPCINPNAPCPGTCKKPSYTPVKH